jgi:predicted HTH domain antitoxin
VKPFFCANYLRPVVVINIQVQVIHLLLRQKRRVAELGRLHLAMEKYRSSEASLEKSARIAGVSVSRMMDLLRDFGIEANLEFEDYCKSLDTARELF